MSVNQDLSLCQVGYIQEGMWVHILVTSTNINISLVIAIYDMITMLEADI